MSPSEPARRAVRAPGNRRYQIAAVVLAVLLVVAIVIAYRVTRPPSFQPVPVPSVSVA